MRLACSTACFPQDRLPIALAKVAWAGYAAVEIDLALHTAPEAELRERLRANDLELAALFAGEMPPAARDADLDELGRIGRAAVLARALDASLVVTAPPRSGALATLADALRALDRALGDLAVEISLVNRPGSILERPEQFRELWDTGLPSRVGIALDPARAALAGWDPAALDALPALPRHVYLNDASGDGRVVPPGEGRLDLEALGRALRRRGYDRAVCLLLENADPWATEPLAKELREAARHWFVDGP